MSDKTNRTIVITAGAAGLGLAMAKAFMQIGEKVAVCDIDANAVANFQSQYPDMIAQTVDVCCEKDMESFFATIKARWGNIDVLCANAGTGGPAGRIEDISHGDWRQCLAVNLDGAFLATKHAVGMMSRGGAILLTSSTAGIAGYPMRSPYATAKWGIIGLMKTLAMELGDRGIRVNALCPGAVEGDRMDRVVKNEAKARGISEDEIRQLYVKGVSLKTWVSADDVANMALFVCSQQANKVSGQSLCIDGHTETLAP